MSHTHPLTLSWLGWSLFWLTAIVGKKSSDKFHRFFFANSYRCSAIPAKVYVPARKAPIIAMLFL